MYVDKIQDKYLNSLDKKKYYIYRIGFDSQEKRKLFESKVKSIRMKTGKTIPDIIIDLLT